MEYKEIKIPVPWGHIAGKSYGHATDDCVIALHGYQDNANSFDKLIQLLPKTFYYIALDLPGHGKSSSFDTTLIVSHTNFILALKIVLDKLNRTKYILLGHSFGSQIATFFTQLYPSYVSKLISIDALFFLPQHPSTFVPHIKRYLNNYEKLNNFTMETAPTYTLEDALQRMKNGRVVNMSDVTAKVLAERSLQPVGDEKFRITTAQFLKYSLLFPLNLKQIIFVIRHYPVQCPHLFIKASGTESFFKMLGNAIEEFQKNAKFEMHTVEGTHDVHVEEPEKVAPIISQFLLKTTQKL